MEQSPTAAVTTLPSEQSDSDSNSNTNSNAPIDVDSDIGVRPTTDDEGEGEGEGEYEHLRRSLPSAASSGSLSSLSSLSTASDEAAPSAVETKRNAIAKPYRKSDVFKEFRQILVIKVGSHLIADPMAATDVQIARLAPVVDAVVRLRQLGVHVVLVTSGALSMGASRLQLKARPKHLPQQQAACAVGQSRLMRIYDDLFSMAGNYPIAQVLITREDLGHRHRYLNALNTFKELMSYNIIPIVNENDSVGVEGLRFQDNDTLAAGVANIIEADYLVFLTNVDYLYTKDPSHHLDAIPIPTVENFATLDVEAKNILLQYGDKSHWTYGGMATMLNAARLACASGVHTVILNGTKPYSMLNVVQGERVEGTHFLAKKRKRLRGKKRWIAGLIPNGHLYLDDGAVKAMRNSSSLFPPGIRRMDGTFLAQSSVALISESTGVLVAHAITNYGSRELAQIIGKKSSELSDILGYNGPETVCHRENIVFLDT
eukprot:TRINITY_DN4154_c0_g2_i1.p1 TRINITY_DN4154_c0_g2~~TRINITY_DN4154_c0_g2_i1.p1  ORF type:complete len:486 (-),score=101.58 TRINITY_DN4154_c0_g2_i1:472-1929(-)